MAFRFILYPFVFWLAGGNSFYSLSNHAPAPCATDARVEQLSIAFIDQANISDLIEEAFPYIVEENSTQNNEDGNEDDEVFDQDGGFQCSWPLTFADLSRLTHTLRTTLPLAGKTAPLYLLNRVFRI